MVIIIKKNKRLINYKQENNKKLHLELFLWGSRKKMKMN